MNDYYYLNLTVVLFVLSQTVQLYCPAALLHFIMRYIHFINYDYYHQQGYYRHNHFNNFYSNARCSNDSNARSIYGQRVDTYYSLSVQSTGNVLTYVIALYTSI